MSENLPRRHRPERTGRSPHRGEDQFSAFLNQLNQRQGERVEQLRTELVRLYEEWARKFELLKEQFGAVWHLFGEIEESVDGWYRGAPNGGQWGFLGVSREGYNFAASVEKNHRRNAPYATKWLALTFACGSAGRGGMGDERMLGRKGRISESLLGLDHCTGKDAHEQLKALRQLNDRAKHCSLVFSLHHNGIGQKHAKVDFSVLQQHRLSDLAQKLFVALNNDELEQLTAALPASTNGTRLITYDPRLLGRG